jgi:predicted nucleotidyltransferase component of viral defense system
MITRQQLEIINRKTLKYPLHAAEKDYFLAQVMQIISTSALGVTLIFKGGTALNHCYLEQYRFSEDLDFSTNQIDLSLEDVRNIFANAPFLTIKKAYQSEATIKIERLQYEGILPQPNSLKVEVDFRQNVLLPPQQRIYKNVWGLDFKVLVMDSREICAEKIRAMSDRARHRDFYDLFLLLQDRSIDLEEVVSYVKQKEIRRPITKENIIQNWSIANSEKAEETKRVYDSRAIDDEKIARMIEDLPISEITP